MAPRRRSLLQVASLAVLSLPRALLAAESLDVRVVIADDTAAQRQILQVLQRRFPGLSAERDVRKLARTGRRVVYIAVGPSALQTALSTRLDGPLVCTFTSRQTYERLLAGSSATASTAITAIYAEPSPYQQMQLIAALYKRQVAVGALLSDQTAYMAPLLQQAARMHGLDLELQFVASDSNLTRALTRLPLVTVLLIFPDAGLYTPQNLRQLLESTYRRRQPVIGFSAALVSAGTLASAYSDVDDTIAQLDSLLRLAVAGHLPEPQYPSYWRVAINDSVARSLNIVVDDTVRGMGDRPS